MLVDLAAVDRVKLAPEGGGTIRALSRIGYDLPEALADLIDNSIDANARRVEITFLRNDTQITSVLIADDGGGMNADGLKLGMQFAGRIDHEADDLGTFGLGLKSASFSQCETLTVVSRRGGETVAARWSVEEIDKGWTCEILDPRGAAVAFTENCLRGKAPATGTLVVWDRLTRLGVGGGDDDLDTFLSTTLARLETHLGLVFHRFLEAEALTISVIVRHEKRALALPRTVRARNPFGYPCSGLKGYPKTFSADLPGVGMIDLEAHVWPSGLQADGFLLGSRAGGPFQGFYFYRNNRLIQAGGWNGVVRNDQDSDLTEARVAVELPTDRIAVNVQKSGLQVTAGQAQAFLQATSEGLSFGDYLDAARAAHLAARRAQRGPSSPPLTPGAGLPSGVRKAAVKRLAKDGPHEELDFVWGPLPADQVFDLDLTETRVILNRDHRRTILGEAPASGADAPLIKMLLFLLFRADFERLRFSAKRREQLEICNALLLDSLKK